MVGKRLRTKRLWPNWVTVQHLPVGNEENHDAHHSGEMMARVKFELCTSLVDVHRVTSTPRCSIRQGGTL